MRKCYFLFFKGNLSVFKNLYIKAALIFVVLLGFSVEESFAQPGAQWEFSRVVDLGPGTPVADFQVKIELNGATEHVHMKNDGNDLRFYVGAVECAYWIERFNPTGLSVIWVKVPAALTTVLTMYYGNPAATTTTSDGFATFDFFDDFNAATIDNTKWVSPSAITKLPSEILIGNTGHLSNKKPFLTDESGITSFYLETKHRESGYNRIRYYITTEQASTTGKRPGGSFDYGYYQNTGRRDSASVFWNGGIDKPPYVYAGTNYITQWQIDDGSTYNWTTINFDTNTPLGTTKSATGVTDKLRYFTFRVTDDWSTFSTIDWVRVRKSGAIPISTPGIEVQVSPNIASFTIGCVGDTITISGSGFTGATEVKFNGGVLPATSFKVINGSTIAAVIPAGVTTGRITVTNGSTVNSPTDFSIVSPPKQYSITGGGAYCEGGSGVPVGLSNSESGVTYQLFMGSTLKETIAGTGSSISFGNQTEAGTYAIVAKRDGSVCTIGMTGTAIITITSIQKYILSVTDEGKYCDGQTPPTISLNGSVTGVNYQLYRNATLLVATEAGTGNALDFGPQALEGIYTVMANTTSPAVCSKEMDGAVTIVKNPLPAVNLEASNPILCFGGSVTITTTPSPDYVNYAFKIGGNTVANGDGTSNILTLTNTNAVAGNNNVTVTVVDNNGCSNSSTSPVLVKASPEITGDIVSTANGVSYGTAKNIEACSGSAIAFAFNDPKPGFNYKFMLAGNPNPLNANLNAPGFSISTLNDGAQISVIVTNTDSCVSTFGPITVTLNPLPEATIAVSASEICKDGASQTITFTGSGGVAPYTFSYKINGVLAPNVTSTGNIATIPFNPTSVGTYNYELISVQDASTTTCLKNISGQSASILVNPLPTATISGTTTVCQGTTNPLITFTGANGTAPFTITYKINGGADQTVITTGNSATVAAPTGGAGPFVYTLVSVKDASSTTCSNGQTGLATVTVNPTPIASISGTATLCQGQTGAVVTFTNPQELPVTITYTIKGGTSQTKNVGAITTATVPVITGAAGVFDYEIVSVAYQAAPTCSTPVSTPKATITINPTPTATISGDASVCQGITPLPVITFTNPQSLPVIITYKINSGTDQAITVGANTTGTVNAPTGTSGSFEYNLVSVAYQNAPLCLTTLTGKKATVIVNPNPTATISGTTDVCANGTAPIITFTGANGTAPYTFYYSVNGGTTESIKTISGNSVTITQPTGTPGIYTYTLQNVVDATTSACTSLASGTAVIKVNPLPTATISSTADVCLNDVNKPVITFTGANGTAPYTFKYTINGGAVQTVISTGNIATVSVPTNVAGTFIYQLESVKDASSTTCSNLQTGSETVVIKALPVIVLEGAETICQGVKDERFFTATGKSNYTWAVTGGMIKSKGTLLDNEIFIDWDNDPGPKSITVNYTDANGCSAAIPATVAATTSTIQPSLITPIASEVCIGETVNYTTQSGKHDYVWTVLSGGTIDSTYNSANVTWTVAGTQTISINYSNDLGCTASSPFIQNVTVHPTTVGGTLSTNQTVCQGSAPSSIVLTGNVGNVVRWEKSTDVGFGTVTTIAITSTTLTAVQVGSLAVTTYIRAWVKSGTCSETPSSTHIITVDPTSVGGTIDGTKTICYGSNSGVLTLSGYTGNIVRWESSTTGAAPWTSITNTNTTYTSANLTTTTHFRAMVKSGICPEIASAATIITVDPATVGGTLSADQTICQNSTPSTITLSGHVGQVLQWEISTDNTFLPGNTTIITNTTTTLTPAEIGSLTATRYVRAIVQSGTCSSMPSAPSTIIVNPTSVGGTIDGTKTICYGSNSGLLTLTGQTGNVIRWESSSNGAAPWTPIANIGNTYTSPNLTTTTHFRAIVQSGNCPEINSVASIITVDPATVGGTLSADQTICEVSAPSNISLSGNVGAVVRWEKSNDISFGSGVTTISNNTTTLTAAGVGALSPTTYIRAIVQSGTCNEVASSTHTITVNPTSVGGTVSGSKTICSGTNSGVLTLSGQIGTVVRWESSTTGTAPWSSITNTSSTYTSPNITITTYFRAVVQSGICAETPSDISVITVSPTTVGGTVGSAATVCSGNNNGTLTLTGQTGSVVRWESSANGTSWDPIANTTTSYNYTNITSTTYYRAIVKSGECAEIPSANVMITVNPAPIANAGVDFSACANAGSINVGTDATAPNAGTYMWTSSGTGGAWTNESTLTAVTYTPSKTDSIAGSVTLTLTVYGTGSCTSITATDTKVLTIQPYPQIVVISPASAETCMGTIIPLTSVKTLVQNGSRTDSRNPNVPIPDNSPAGVFSTINFSNIPPQAIIDSMVVQFTISHPVDADLNINLKAPNGKVLNLAHALTGVNYTNTIISSTSTKPIQTFGTAPYNEYPYAPKAQIGIRGASSVPGGNTPFIKTFNDLYSVPNGNWTFSVRDGGSGVNSAGLFNSWNLSIYYHTPEDPVKVLWSPAENLYTDAAATIPYTGELTSVVYAKPDTEGIKTYTATNVNTLGCSSFNTVDIKVNAAPVININTDYCTVPNRVTLVATPAATSYSWSTGGNTQSVLADVAGTYYVSTTNSAGCVATAEIDIAEELVINGDFELGNFGFETPPLPGTPIKQYVYAGPGPSALTTEGLYGVGTDGQSYHNNFWGRDHTTGEGNFMLVNGYRNAQPVVWQQTVTVKPNTTYYFSAWGMSLNNMGPFASLQFNVNGEQVGSVAVLPPGISGNSNPWRPEGRFYGNWTSGDNITSAVISITNIEPSASGNDFGLDDISFATLSPFVTYDGDPGLQNQEICLTDSLKPIKYLVGSGLSGPLLKIIPENNNIKGYFDGRNYVIRGTSTVVGTYNYEVYTECGGVTKLGATGTFTVKPNSSIALSSAGSTTNQNLCISSPIIDIKYKITNGTVGVVKDLPEGVTYNYAGGILSIFGTPTVSGTFTYKAISLGTCYSDSLTGTFVISPKPIGGNLSSQTICIGEPATLTLTGVTGEIVRWEYSNDGFATFSPLATTQTSQTFTEINQSTSYRVVIKNDGVCSNVTSTVGKISVKNMWEGKYDNDWSFDLNWSTSTKPVINASICADIVTIPKGIPYNPIVSTGEAVKNLNITSAGHLIINGTGNLKIAGNLKNQGIFDVTNGTVEFNGATIQTIKGSDFLIKTLKNLVVSNKAALNISPAPADTLNIIGELSFGNTTAKLNSGDNITLKSSKAATANVGIVAPGNTITGKFVVERFINTGLTANGGHRKSWQLLAIPTKGQSIKDSWMEGATKSNIPTNPSTSTASERDPHPGYGTMITSAVPGAGTQPSPGFDVFTAPGSSMKSYDTATGAYDKGPASTELPIYNEKGYLILVRGDRSVYTSNGDPTPTVLRTKGTLITGNTPVMNFNPNTWNSVGNPYASAIDFSKVSKGGSIDDLIAVWDPLLTGDNGLGSWVYLAKDVNGIYSATPSAPSYSGSGPVYIQSGQAFMVQTAPANGGSIQFTENAKTSGSNMIMRGQTGNSKIAQLRTNLFSLEKNGSAVISDGILLQFGEDLSNDIDGKDARKMSNTSENLSIKSNGIKLAIERRQPVNTADTIFLNLTGVRVQDYRFNFEAKNLQSEGLQGYLEDLYLGTSTRLNLESFTLINFKIENIPGSYASDRFRIVFKSALGPLPIKFVGINAAQVKEDILVSWNVENEINVLGYDVEKSTDGQSFTKIGHLSAKNSKSYNWLDEQVHSGNHYYRIKVIEEIGKTELSSIVKVLISSEPSRITVYPNPITNGVVNVHLINQPAGKYKIRLLNPVGQVIVNKIVTHGIGNSIHPIDWDYKLAKGMYQIEVTKPDGGVNLIKIVY